MPSVFGETFVTLLKMLINTRKRVTSKAILPGTTWIMMIGMILQFESKKTRRKSCEDYLRGDEKADPGCDDKECRGEVVDVPELVEIVEQVFRSLVLKRKYLEVFRS